MHNIDVATENQDWDLVCGLQCGFDLPLAILLAHCMMILFLLSLISGGTKRMHLLINFTADSAWEVLSVQKRIRIPLRRNCFPLRIGAIRIR